MNKIVEKKININEYFLNFFSIKNKKTNINTNRIIGILFPATNIEKKIRIKKIDKTSSKYFLFLYLKIKGVKKKIKILYL